MVIRGAAVEVGAALLLTGRKRNTQHLVVRSRDVGERGGGDGLKVTTGGTTIASN